MNTTIAKKQKLTPTQKVIQSQLLENTGINMMDSGGTNGRGWQRNQANGIKFNEPVKVDQYGYTIPVQTYMDTMLERDALCPILERTLKAKLKRDGEYPELSYYNGQNIIDYLNEMDYEVESDWQNTYNGDCDLSQTLQMLVFKQPMGEWYVIIETHNGADVRGGYSKGRIYKIRDFDYFITGIVVSRFEAQDDNGETIKDWESQYQMMNDCQWEESSNTWVYEGRAIFYYSEAEGY